MKQNKVKVNYKKIGRLGIVGVGIFTGITYLLGKKVYKGTVGMMQGLTQKDLNVRYKDIPEVVKAYQSHETKEKSIISNNGYDVEMKYVYSKSPTQHSIVIIPGIGSDMYQHLREVLMYLENEFNVIIYNQRYTGKTGGNNRTFGYYEQYDLAAVISDIRKQYPKHIIGAHGFSMGAATLAMYSGQQLATEELDYMILDSPFDTMKKVIEVGVASKRLPIPTAYGVWSGNVYNRIKSNFRYTDVNPIEQIAKSKIPMYIIHGDADEVCPVGMAQAMYEVKQEGYKELWIEEGATHVKIMKNDPIKYEQQILKFIATVEKNRNTI